MSIASRKLRVLFAGRGNAFNRGMIHWLGGRHTVVGALFLEIDRNTLGGRMRRIRGRARRYGIGAAADELAFHIYDSMLHGKRERALSQAQFPREFVKKGRLPVPHYFVDDLHSDRWLAKAREFQPDIVFSICASVIFRKEFYTIPALGTFVLHEGITPEYRGLHTALWALLNRDYPYIGYSLLKVDDSIDGGQILCQGRYALEPGEDYRTWSFVGHKAILRGLPEIEAALDRLAADRCFTPVPQAGRRSGYYTWMRLSKYLRMKKRQPSD